MKSFIFVLLLILSIFMLENCASESSVPEAKLSVFRGKAEDVAKAEAMFKAIGGKDNWAKIKSLYVKSSHSDNKGALPYQNEMWREFDEFKLKIEQQNSNFHRRGYFSNAGGWIELVSEDTVQLLNDPALRGVYREHELNIYSILNNLASDQGISVRTGKDGRLEFVQNLITICAFSLDEQNLPTEFVTRSIDGLTAKISQYSTWKESSGFMYPEAGGAADSSFFFKTEVWKGQRESFTDVEFVYKK